MNRPVDVLATDKPAADNEYYLKHGADFVKRNWTKGNWSPGDLLGANGSDPATKAQSASYATPDQWDKLTENRSATSIGHVHHRPRPERVCLGWGDYDQYATWQSHGLGSLRTWPRRGTGPRAL